MSGSGWGVKKATRSWSGYWPRDTLFGPQWVVEDSARQRGPVATAALKSVSPSESQSLKKQEAH